MNRFLLLFIFLCPFNVFAENTALDSSIYEVMHIGFMLPPADLKWTNTSANANYTDIKAKIRKQLQDALLLNKKYPNITQNQKNNIIFRYNHLQAELQDSIKNNKINGVDIPLYKLFLDLSMLSINEYKGDISNFASFDESYFYVTLRSRILISYILFNINYMPEVQKIILEYTNMYINKYREYMQNDFKTKITKYDYYKAYKKAADELTKAVYERYSLNKKVNLAEIKDKNGNSLKGMWFSIDFDKAGSPLFTTYYSLFFGGYTGYHYYNFSSDYNFVETFYTNADTRTALLLYPKAAYVKNDVLYVTLENDPVNNQSEYTKPLYIQARFKNASLLELTDSYYDGISLFVDNMDKYIKPYSIKLYLNQKVSKDNLEKNILSFIKKSDKYADIENAGRFVINNKTFYIFISYHNYAYGYDGVNSRWKDIVITFWEDMGQYAVLKDYSYIDNGGTLQQCSSQNNMLICDFMYRDERSAYGNNFYTYILDNDKFYIYSYKNITGIEDKKTACTYYAYNVENKKPVQDITLDYLKNLRDKSYNSKKCFKLVGIE
ncbi:MAG: hypothetical protein K2N11_06715 [Mucispirillum sp.]|nr:hypothetical protein [Mucispirillum sp.]